MEERKLCLITFSNNADHQNTVYSMFNALYPENDVYTIGIVNPKVTIAPKTENNFYVKCPLRPGIDKGTFNFKVLLEIRNIIKKRKIDCLYFESQHLWNMFVMLMFPFKRKIVAVHDVIPHDGNKFMTLSNYVTCHMANHVILRNTQQKELLARKYNLKLKDISCFELWRDYPQKTELLFSKVFLCFGRIRKYKGFDLLAKIVEKAPNIKFRVVGEADEESKCLVDMIKEFTNVEIVEREISDEEMVEEFRRADWLILPYASATQSGVITDACRYARPVIAFNVGAISEQIVDKKTGFLVESGNVDLFVQRILEANAMSREELRNLSENAYHFGFNKYSANEKANDFYRLIQNIE